jgi:hypothetical protein
MQWRESEITRDARSGSEAGVRRCPLSARSAVDIPRRIPTAIREYCDPDVVVVTVMVRSKNDISSTPYHLDGTNALDLSPSLATGFSLLQLRYCELCELAIAVVKTRAGIAYSSAD